MKKWMAGAVVIAGLSVFGGAAVAQDVASGDGGQRPGAQGENLHTGDHEGCRFGKENLRNDT